MQEKIRDEGRYQMVLDHQEHAVLFFNSNKERLDALKRWFPCEYEKMEKLYPMFFAYPDEYPPLVIDIVNQHMQQMLPPGAFSELSFK